ncbi:MAG: ribosomal-processing cysteine protease Prp [bacterium]
MIKVRFKKSFIEIKGHANQNPHGTDIVCASVSTAVIMTINQIDIFNMSNDINVEMTDGFTKITIINENDNLNKIISNLIYTLNNLGEDYPKFIKIEN